MRSWVSGEDKQREATGRHASLVAAGILASRIAGLVRQRVFGYYFGLSDAADAFNAAFRIPNFLQNLFGEGVLSASFIPVYARLVAEGDEEESGRVAGAVGAMLALATSVLVLVGVLATPYLIYAIAPGFHGAKRELTIRLVRILFPGAGLLVCSAWCLGILNSHRKFFLSYTAPVMWNAAMIATLVIYGGLEQSALAVNLAWGSVIGSGLQFGVQLPVVLRLARHVRVRLDTRAGHVREVMRNFAPVFVSRGVVQISGYVDQLLASKLGEGAVAGLTNAQSINTLPVSLFGMAVSAAELPAMSSALGDQAEVGAQLRPAAGCGAAADRVFRGALGHGAAGAGRRGDGGAVSDGEVHAQRLGLRVGNSGRLGGGPAGVDAGAAVFVHLLRAPGHAHAAAIRGGARGAHHRAGLPVLDSAADVDRDRSALGRGGTDGVGGRGGMGGVRAAAPDVERAHRADRPRGGADGEVMDIGGGGGGGGVGGEARHRARGHPIVAAVAILGTYGVVYFGDDVLACEWKSARERCEEWRGCVANPSDP